MPKYNILIVEDKLIPANYFKKVLKRYGHKVVGIATSKQSAMQYIYNKISIDLVLMDIKIKGKKDGIDIAKMMQSYISVAILFISAYSDKDFLDRAKNVNSIGYLVKPIQANTLLTTIEVEMPNFKLKIENNILSLSDEYIFDIKHQIISKEREIIDLSYSETIILETLLLNKEGLTSIEELENALYKLDFFSEGALRTTMWRLRKKLPKCMSIKTFYKSGYKIKFLI